MKQMDMAFWDNMAKKYFDEIFDTLSADKNGIIKKYINEESSNTICCCDFGCGVGNYIKILSSQFKKVYALDVSRNCLEMAKKIINFQM